MGCSETKTTRNYLEKDNLGTRQDTEGKANAYWTTRASMSEKPPFTLFTFTSASDAEKALLALPFIHKAKDTGNLICLEILIFGYYKTKEGEYEAIICGKSLTKKDFDLTERAFENHGGKLKNNLKPLDNNTKQIENKKEENITKEKDNGNPNNVRFNKKYQEGLFTYECYRGNNKADAMAFLKDKNVSESLYYIIVETPEGNFGRDKGGIYEE